MSLLRPRSRTTGDAPAELTVDWTLCDGRGLCAELLPERVLRDDWGYPVVAPGAVPRELRAHAEHAVRACPRLALALQPTATTPRRVPG